MRITSGDIIVGQPALSIRTLFLSSGGTGSINTIAELLEVDVSLAQTIYQQLLQEGYIEPKENHHKDMMNWQTTVKGNALAHATARKPITRKTADKLIIEFMQRVKEINSSDEYVYYVKEVRVFGSYLTESPNLGDIDLAITIECRYEDMKKREEQSQKRIQQALEQGRTFRNIVEHYAWPQFEIFRILKHRSPSLSIHDARVEQDFLQSVPSRLLFEAQEEDVKRM